MTSQLLIVGGGIGGLAAGIACGRAGWECRLYEQAEQFSEVGAGIQLGPNATRLLAVWGLAPALRRAAAFPGRLVARCATTGQQLAVMALADVFTQRYGAPYATVHRADLQGLLLAAAREAGVGLHLSARVAAVREVGGSIRLRIEGRPAEVEGDALAAADGLWSQARAEVCGDGAPLSTGHLAYRSLAAQADLPASLRSQDVTVWLGPDLHVVCYPVKAGLQLNVVVIVQGNAPGDPRLWDRTAAASPWTSVRQPLCSALHGLVDAMPGWRLWSLHERRPMLSADEMARGRIALIGDAAHPMRPYLAQGAAMAIEDAAELGRALAMSGSAGIEVPLALRRYALNRWQRAARVQARARRNGRIFHATGLVRWARDASLRMLGERLLDQPWLYRP